MYNKLFNTTDPIELNILISALERVIDISNSDTKDSFNASRYLLTCPWKSNTKVTISKEDKEIEDSINIEDIINNANVRINNNE